MSGTVEAQIREADLVRDHYIKRQMLTRIGTRLIRQSKPKPIAKKPPPAELSVTTPRAKGWRAGGFKDLAALMKRVK